MILLISILLHNFQKDLQNLDDAADELLLIDEEEIVPYPF
jgi:hypothetical protein